MYAYTQAELAEKIGVESLKARENRMYTYGIEFH